MSFTKTTEVDSRYYSFSYLIRSPGDLPEDFPIPPEQVRIGVFLPRGDPDWFGRSKFPPRILVLGADSILALTHPNCGGGSVRISLADIVFYEVGHILLIGWLRFMAAESEVRLPYNTRSDRPIRAFLTELAQTYLPSEPDHGSCEMAAFGSPLDIKFRNHLEAALQQGERIRAQWFSPPMQVARRGGPFRIRSEEAGDLLALMNQRILWITDRREGCYERYGNITRTGPLREIDGVRCQCDGSGSALTICFRGAVSWHIPLRCDQIEAAQSFAESLGAYLRSYRNLIMTSIRSGANLT